MSIPENSSRDKTKYYRISYGFGNLSKLNQLQLLKCVQERNVVLQITVYGKSMVPYIKNNDVITLSPLKEKSLQIGDIVAFESLATQKPVIHRVIHKKNGMFLMKGDNCVYSDGEISKDWMLGLVANIERNGRSANFGISRAKLLIAGLSRINILQKIVSIFNL